MGEKKLPPHSVDKTCEHFIHGFGNWIPWRSQIPWFIFGFSIEIEFLRQSPFWDKPICASTIFTNSFPRSPSSIFSLGFGRDFTAA
jgi:hypothetical protein